MVMAGWRGPWAETPVPRGDEGGAEASATSPRDNDGSQKRPPHPDAYPPPPASPPARRRPTRGPQRLARLLAAGLIRSSARTTATGPPGRSAFAGDADQRAVLGPRAVVVLHRWVAQQLMQHEPGVGRPLADAAIGDHASVGNDALALVEGVELVRRPEGAVIVGSPAPGDVHRTGNVARHLSLLLGQMLGRETLAPILLGRADVDELLLTELGQHLVAQRPQLTPDQARDTQVGRRDGGDVLGELASVELPLLAPAVEQLHGIEPEVAAQPVGVGGEPVVVPAVEHDGRVRADARPLEEAAQALLVDVVPSPAVVEIDEPVPADRVADVASLVGGGVLVDLDQPNAGVAGVPSDPIGVHERLGVHVITHPDLPDLACGAAAREPGAAQGPLHPIVGTNPDHAHRDFENPGMAQES